MDLKTSIILKNLVTCFDHCENQMKKSKGIDSAIFRKAIFMKAMISSK